MIDPHGGARISCPHESRRPEQFLLGQLLVDLEARLAGDEALTEQECEILRCLASREQGITTKEDLYREVWGTGRCPEDAPWTSLSDVFERRSNRADPYPDDRAGSWLPTLLVAGADPTPR